MELLLQESKIMFKYTISFSNKSKKELVSGKSDDYNTAFDKAQSIVKSLFSEAILSEKFNEKKRKRIRTKNLDKKTPKKMKKEKTNTINKSKDNNIMIKKFNK